MRQKKGTGGAMKLTDEQRDEIQGALNRYNESGVDEEGMRARFVIELSSIDWIEDLLSSERAWKAEAKEESKRMIQQWRRAVIAEKKLNEAVEVLKDMNAHMDLSEEIPSGESMGEFKDASGINAVFKRAYDFISSLSQGTEGKP